MKKLKTKKPKASYTYQQICELLCEACRFKLPINTHVFEDKSYRIYHMVNGKDITCDAEAWRQLATHVDGEVVNVIVKRKITVK